MELFGNNCVWISHWEMVKDAESGKTRRVRRARPKVYAGTVYTVWPMEQDNLHPFVAWTGKALRHGESARHYGRPVGVFFSGEEMYHFVQWYEALIDWALEYGHTWFRGSPVQMGWNGVHDSGDRGDCKTCVALPQAFGNLVWAKVRGLRTRRTDESVALLDLEQITRSDEYGTYVRVMHASPRDYWNDGVYATEIVEAPARAMRVIRG